jgi:hypothetical protein
MSQDYVDDVYDQDHVVDTDMEKVENDFAALKSAFSGASSPSNPVPGMAWFDTGKKILKRRNVENTVWYGMLWGDGDFKIPVYRNDAQDGFLIDSTVFDCVVAIKGGSQAYNVSGGQVAGSWTTPYHTLINSEMPSHSHIGTTDADGRHNHNFSGDTPRYGYAGADGSYGRNLVGEYPQYADLGVANSSKHSHDFTTGSKGGGNPHRRESA